RDCLKACTMMPMCLFILAQVTAPVAPPWYQVATGIIAVPAALIALVYSIALLKKARVEALKLDVDRRKAAIETKKMVLESQKLEMEIREKLNSAVPSSGHLEASLNAINTLFQTQQVGLLLLRFIILYLVLGIWRLLSAAYEYAFFGVISVTFGFDQINS